MQHTDRTEESAAFQRVVSKNASRYHYLKVSLVLGNQDIPSAVELKLLIIQGLQNLYGEVGAAFPFDLLSYVTDSLTFVLRVYSRGLVKLWSSLTLLGFYQKQRCAFMMLQVSPFLLALSGNSRELKLD